MVTCCFSSFAIGSLINILWHDLKNKDNKELLICSERVNLTFHARIVFSVNYCNFQQKPTVVDELLKQRLSFSRILVRALVQNYITYDN